MEQTTSANGRNTASPDPGYWTSVLIVSGIFSIAGFAINIIFGYVQIASEPGGTVFSPMMLGSVVVCLATCLGGLAAVWHVTRYITPRMKLGRGALIGFLTGAMIVLFSTLLNELWVIFDPGYTERLLDSVVENVEAMDLPADTQDQMIDQMAAGVRDTSVFQQLVVGIPVTGLLNLLTGMLGVRFFAVKEEDYEDYTE